jgi:hypothetical protein
MFCENCGTRVEDGQPFCPNCGKRMGAPASNAAPANSGYGAPASSRPVRPMSNSGGLLGKFNAMQGLEKIFFPIFGGLLVLNFLLFLLPSYYYGTTIAMSRGYPFWSALITILLTLCLTFFVQDYFDKFSFKWLWIMIAAAMVLILLLFIILWIDSEVKLSVFGWFFFIFQIGLAGSSIMLLLEKMKR